MAVQGVFPRANGHDSANSVLFFFLVVHFQFTRQHSSIVKRHELTQWVPKNGEIEPDHDAARARLRLKKEQNFSPEQS